MWYYTNRALRLHNCSEPLSVIADLRDTNYYAKYWFDENGETQEADKWYACKEHMLAFSLKYPTVRFQIDCDWEETGDVYQLHFLNGKMCTCKQVCTMESFNPDNLL